MITTLYAGLLALLYIALMAYVGHGRFKYRVGLGDGGIMPLQQRIRVHANFAEYVPFALFLIFLVDYSQYSPVMVHILGISLLVGRIFHAWGLSSSPNLSFGRQAGAGLTVLVIVACAILLIWKFVMLRIVGF